MNDRQVLFETKLAQAGAKLSWGAVLALILFVSFGLFGAFLARFPGNLLPIAWTVLAAVTLGGAFLKVWPLRTNPSVFRVALDDFGLYVQSDAPALQMSFSVVATDIHRLIHRIERRGETSDDHEYFVETKSGQRYQINDLFFVERTPTVLEVFERVAKKFAWVEIAEEIQP